MASSSGATGESWQSKLMHIQYEDDKVKARYEFFTDLNHMTDDCCGFYSLPTNSPFRSKIIKASAFIIDLPVKKWLPRDAARICTHHIVEIEAESGDYFTLEKGKDCILLQSCRRTNPEMKPIIRIERNGVPRVKLKSLERIMTELNPKSTTVFDLLLWLNEKGADGRKESRLMEPYHVAYSNCQHFARQLWHELSEKDYPNPSRFTSEGAYNVMEQEGKLL